MNCQSWIKPTQRSCAHNLLRDSQLWEYNHSAVVRSHDLSGLPRCHQLYFHSEGEAMWLLLQKSLERMSKTPSRIGVTVWPLHNTWILRLMMYVMYQTDAYCRSLSNRQIQNQIWILSQNSSMGLTRKKIPKLRRRLPIQAHQEMRTSLATRVTWCRTLTMTRIMLRTSSLSTCHQRRYAYACRLHPPYMLQMTWTLQQTELQSWNICSRACLWLMGTHRSNCLICLGWGVQSFDFCEMGKLISILALLLISVYRCSLLWKNMQRSKVIYL